MTVKEIREALMTPGTIFKAPVGLFKNKMEEFKCGGGSKFDIDEQIWVATGEVDSISSTDRYYYNGMNVDRFGPTCVWLYTFDMLKQRSVGKIRYKDVEIVSVGEPVVI